MRSDESLTKIKQERKLLKIISKRKTSSLRHVLHRNCLQLRITEEKMEGKRGRGRRKFGIFDDIRNVRDYRQMQTEAQEPKK